MKFSLKNILIFTGVYLLIIFVTNLAFIPFVNFKFSYLITTITHLTDSFSGPLSCKIFPAQQSLGAEKVSCPVNYGIILANFYFAFLSNYLLFTKKLKFYQWVISFVVIYIVVLGFLYLKDYLLIF